MWETKLAVSLSCKWEKKRDWEKVQNDGFNTRALLLISKYEQWVAIYFTFRRCCRRRFVIFARKQHPIYFAYSTQKKYIYKIPFEVPNFISTILFHLMKFIKLCNHVGKSVHKELYSLLVHLSRQFCWILVASAVYFSFRFCFSLSLNWKRPQHLCTDRTITTTMNNGILFAGTKHCYGWYGMDEGCASVSVSESVPFSLFPTLSVYKCVSSNL